MANIKKFAREAPQLVDYYECFIHCEGGDISVVTILEDEDPALLFIRLVPAVNDLVTSPTELNALTIVAGELSLGTSSKLH